MSKMKTKKSGPWRPERPSDNSRREFLAYSGATLAVTGLVLTGCSDDDDGILDNVDKPIKPSNLTADNAISGQVVLSWQDNMVGEDGFSIERSLTTDNADFAEIATVGENIITYTDTNVDLGTVYFYRVRSFEGTDFSKYSNVVSSEGAVRIDLGSGDVGVLNYAFALEQLEAAFYTAVVSDADFETTFSAGEQQVLMDLEQHEIIHREFFRTAIDQAAGDGIIPDLNVDFSGIDFSNRENVLEVAQTFEDLGVAAYNGAGKLLETPIYLTLAGKIVSVEARHAAAIRDILSPDAPFSLDPVVIDENGLDRAMPPSEVLAAAQPFILETLDGSNLPTA